MRGDAGIPERDPGTGPDPSLTAFPLASLCCARADASPDIYNAKRTSMDFSASYELPQSWTIHVSARNLLDTPHTFYQGTPNRPIQREFHGLTYMAGVRFEY